MNNDDAHTIALEWLKQLITLSSSIVVFSGTLIGVVMDQPNWTIVILGVSWILFIAAILLGLETITAITYSRINKDDSWTRGSAEKKARTAKRCFTWGMITFALFAGVSAAGLL